MPSWFSIQARQPMHDVEGQRSIIVPGDVHSERVPGIGGIDRYPRTFGHGVGCLGNAGIESRVGALRTRGIRT